MAPVKLILATDGNINEQSPVKAFDWLKSFYFKPSKVKLIQVTKSLQTEPVLTNKTFLHPNLMLFRLFVHFS